MEFKPSVVENTTTTFTEEAKTKRLEALEQIAAVAKKARGLGVGSQEWFVWETAFARAIDVLEELERGN